VWTLICYETKHITAGVAAVIYQQMSAASVQNETK